MSHCSQLFERIDTLNYTEISGKRYVKQAEIDAA